jgi:hypothetical protein
MKAHRAPAGEVISISSYLPDGLPALSAVADHSTMKFLDRPTGRRHEPDGYDGMYQTSRPGSEQMYAKSHRRALMLPVGFSD